MIAQRRMTLLAAILAGAGLLATGCGERSTEKVGANIDRAATNMAAATEKAADKMAATTEQAADKTIAVVGDAAITGKVKAAMMAEPGLSSLKIDVDTKDNVVTLNGTVPSQAEKTRAIDVAQKVSDVKSVVDNLLVKSQG